MNKGNYELQLLFLFGKLESVRMAKAIGWIFFGQNGVFM